MSEPPALLLHLALPTWCDPRDADRRLREQICPLIQRIVDRPHSTALVLGGRLVEVLAEAWPEVLLALRQAIEGGRVEVVASALHDARLAALAERDALGQLRAHTTLLKRVLGARPDGVWLPGMAWEPSLPRLLNRAGLRWTVLPAAWLDAVGAPAGPALTVEREGKSVTVLRGTEQGPGVRCVAPRDASSVARCMALLATTSQPVASLLAGPRTRAYLPSGGAEGVWERALLQDAGADTLHKASLALSAAIGRVADAPGGVGEVVDPRAMQQARRYLYRCQAPEAYVRSPLLVVHRDRAWRDLLRAERILDRTLERRLPRVELEDRDLDGEHEVRLRSEAWALAVAPARRGALLEMASMRCAANLLCGPIPHAFAESWADGTALAERFELVTTELPGDGVARAMLVADSRLDDVPIRVTKGLQVGRDGPLALRLEVVSRGDIPARGHLCTELLITAGGRRFEGDEVPSLAVEVAGGREPLDEAIELPGLDALGVVGWRFRVDLELRPAAFVVIEPAGDGVGRLTVQWPVDLFPRDRLRLEVDLRVREAPAVTAVQAAASPAADRG